jgi:hypothetical protein
MGSDLQGARHRVAEQLATRVHAWADSTDHDPGVSLLELMAFLADALSDYQDAAADEAGSRFVGARVQQGRVSIDADWNEAGDLGRFYGIYRGVVIDNVDPQQQRRLLVRAPSVSPDPLWALPALTVTKGIGLPGPGEAVWVLFEAGDPERPVWLA